MGKNYTLTNIDAVLLREFKTACAHYDISMRATLIKHIQNIVNDYRVHQFNSAFAAQQRRKRRKK